jgi:DUF2911 family protein
MRKPTSLLPCALLLIASPALAQGNPRGEAKTTVGGKNVVIEYGRPSLKGRDMLAEAAVDKPWRMGADAPTTLETDADLTFGAVLVPQGRYVLNATKVAEDKWVLNVLKAEPADGGPEKTKIADVPLSFSKVDTSVEMLTIELKGGKNEGEFLMRWGHASLAASFTGK